jgi:LysM repeat protein
MQRFMTIGVAVALCVIAVGVGLLIATTFGGGDRPPSGFATAIPTSLGQSATQATAAPATAPAITEAPVPTNAPTSAATSAPTASAEATAAPVEIPTTAPTASTEPTDVPATVAPTASATAASADGYIDYTVQKGDILYRIAEKYGVSVEELLAVNQIPNPKSLTVGSVIRIPKK